ncbi:hypothetical protein [Butyrivibrio sp. JL13D10]|uniref:hypothetical protein n=1 Tax=Butyrivibrio sp. JL13D10 TaxID=3236815 RepID=UPI0038B502C8
MYSHDRTGLGAYMTVEAALVIPSAIFGIVLIVYMSFLVYGRCILSQDVYILGFRAALFYENQGYASLTEYVVDHAQEKTGEKYFGSTDPEIIAKQSGKEITIQGKITTNHGALYSYFSGIPGLWESEAKAGLKLRNNAKTVRRIKRGMDIAGKHLKKERE